jgi:hypothetical protein
MTSLVDSGGNQQPKCILGLGASAGGLEAIETFFTHFPANENIAFVVVSHLSPDYKDLMVDLLQQHTTMRVTQATHKELVKPNCIYVVAPNTRLTIKFGRLYMSKPNKTKTDRKIIDIFLTSLANDQRGSAIGVLLSGMGDDGQTGCSSIKAEHGGVFAQSVDSASYPSMPASLIATGIVDGIASPDHLPELILNYIKQNFKSTKNVKDIALIPPEISSSEIKEIDQVIVELQKQTNQDFSQYKKNTVYRRIKRRMDIHHIMAINDYALLLNGNKHEAELLFKELLIGVTHFFRDSEVWDYLKSDVLPSLINNFPEGGVLRAWVPACSTGEEVNALLTSDAKDYKEKISQLTTEILDN